MSDSQQPLLSICIPTYNRSQYLKKTLDSIICQEEFSPDNVEIVISDNCSTDDTEIVCKEYTEQYENIKYFRNTENIRDRNFPLVLSKGSGVLLKLCNDTLIFNDFSLSKLLELVVNNKKEKPVIFTSNGNCKINDKCSFTSLEDFMYNASFWITWIGGYCIWKEHWNEFGNTEDGCKESLWQVPSLLKYINNMKKAIICNAFLFTIQTVEKKNISYGLYKVFYINYLGFIRNYINNGISQTCYDWLEEDLLFNFYTDWMIQYKLHNNHLEYSKSENLLLNIYNSYKNKSYYKKFKIYLYKHYLKAILKEKIKAIIKLR